MTFHRQLAARLFLTFCLLVPATMAHAGGDANSLTVSAVGDVMPSSSFPTPDTLSTIPTETFEKTFRGFFKGADIRFGNLEGTMADDAPCLKACAASSSCYAFNIPSHYAGTLKRAGFNLLSLANNHISDFGKPGRESTVRHLTRQGIACGGTAEKPSDIFYANGLKVGFAAFAPHKGVADLLDLDTAVKRVKKLNATCDIVVVSIHGGAEGAGADRVPRSNEIYLGEDRGDLYAFSHALVDAGADLILGHGPHVVRGMELYKGRLIAYSLGNFFTWARFNLDGPKGVAPVLTAILAPDGHFRGGRILSLRQPYLGLPVADPTQAAVTEMARLSRADFPESPLFIADDGSLSPSTPKS